MNFEIVPDMNYHDQLIIRILDHELLDQVVIAINVLNNGTADITTLKSNGRFDIEKHEKELQTWMIDLQQKIVQFHRENPNKT